jgi:hypothetical protein
VQANEIKIEVTFEKHLENKILKALFKSHLYEEVAYEIYKENTQNIGLGMIGNYKTHEGKDFLLYVKEKCTVAESSFNFIGKEIKKKAVLGGAGSFAIKMRFKRELMLI